MKERRNGEEIRREKEEAERKRNESKGYGRAERGTG